jgi:hypothetical protein
MEGMGFIGRHDDHLAFFEQELGFFYGDLCFAVNDGGDRIERCGMFRQAFTGIESKEGDGTAFFIHDHTAHYGTILVRDEVFWIQDFSGKVFVGFFWHGITYASLLLQGFIKSCF